jgi:hypothetical protein
MRPKNSNRINWAVKIAVVCSVATGSSRAPELVVQRCLINVLQASTKQLQAGRVSFEGHG